MIADSIDLLVAPGEIHAYVDGLWSDGPIRASHRGGGLVHRLVERFAAVPRLFYRPSDIGAEWTHFSPWWGAILLCDYANPVIRDLRYLHEIYHAATFPHLTGLRSGGMAARSFANEREASTFTEIAIYLELPELRPLSFDHAIFADRLVFPSGDLTRPDPVLLDRWRADRRAVFAELMFRRLDAVLARPDEIDPGDPQLVWLRRYAEQGDAWVRVWATRHGEVDASMVALRDGVRAGDRPGAAYRWRDWLLAEAGADPDGIPFGQEARTFRTTFDALLASYDAAMTVAGKQAVRHL